MKNDFLKKLLVLLLAALCLTSCTNNKEKTVIFDEGVDTQIEVISYHPYEGSGVCFLNPGDKVAVISPSAYPDEKSRDAVMEGLKGLGYEPIEGKYTVGEMRTLENVIEDLDWALSDDQIKAIFCIRGGAGSSQLLDHLDLDLIRNKRKPIIGFSDITTFLNIWAICGVPSIHGAMADLFMDLPAECAEVEKHVLQGELPSYRVAGSEYDKTGSAEGILVGGNLSVTIETLSTADDPLLIERPYILFIEDVAEDTEHIWRYLSVLKNAGVLDKASGIIFGEFTEVEVCETYDGSSRGGKFASVAEMINREFMNDAAIPVAYGFPAGHGINNYPLLFGEQVRLEVKEDFYTIEWE